MGRDIKVMTALVTRRELAAKFDVVMMTITKWEREGMPITERGRRGKPSRYSVPAVAAWLDQREEAARIGTSLDLVQERARKERAQAILAEQTVAIRAGELVPRAETERVWIAEIVAVRAKLLAWPATLSNQLHRERIRDGAAGLERVLKIAVDEVLLELSTGARPPKPRTKKRTARK